MATFLVSSCLSNYKKKSKESDNKKEISIEEINQLYNYKCLLRDAPGR